MKNSQNSEEHITKFGRTACEIRCPAPGPADRAGRAGNWPGPRRSGLSPAGANRTGCRPWARVARLWRTAPRWPAAFAGQDRRTAGRWLWSARHRQPSKREWKKGEESACIKVCEKAEIAASPHVMSSCFFQSCFELWINKIYHISFELEFFSAAIQISNEFKLK